MENFRSTAKKIAECVDNGLDFLIEFADMLSSKGDFDKAIGIREELLGRDYPNNIREKIMISLASDFHKAGMYENALGILDDAFIISANKDVILDITSHLSSEVNDWEKVVYYQKKKQKIDESYLAYALCQWSKDLIDAGNLKEGSRKLIEAGMIIPGNIHMKLHSADLLLKDGRFDELVAAGKEISRNNPEFFSIFLNKFIDSGIPDDNVRELISGHLELNSSDAYSIRVFGGYLIRNKRFEEAIEFIEKHYGSVAFNPYILKLYIQALSATGRGIDSSYTAQVLRIFGEPERWFRCGHCGYETEYFSFVCIRCSRLDTMKSIW